MPLSIAGDWTVGCTQRSALPAPSVTMADDSCSPADDAAATAEDMTAGLRPADRQRIEKVCR